MDDATRKQYERLIGFAILGLLTCALMIAIAIALGDKPFEYAAVTFIYLGATRILKSMFMIDTSDEPTNKKQE